MNSDQKILIYMILVGHRLDLARAFAEANNITPQQVEHYLIRYAQDLEIHRTNNKRGYII